MSSTPVHRTWALALVVATAAAAGWCIPPAAGADATETTPVMVVLDASGSMTAADAPGPRIDAAKKAVTGLVSTLPSGARVGLEVYGTSTGSSDAEKAAGCKDIKVAVPVGPVDKASFDARVGAIRASGYTPIGSALRTAAAALPQEGPRSIVLVSDGEDTCAPPDPCQVAKQLKQQGVDLVVHTIGFKVGQAARKQLSCIASATGGTYRDANDGPALGTQLQTQVQRALQPYAATGTPIRGASAPAATAPELKPGQYLDSIEVADTDTGPGELPTNGRYYRVKLNQGETPYISATVVPPGARTSEPSANLEIAGLLFDHLGSSCEVDTDNRSEGSSGKVAAISAVLSPGAVGGSSWPKECPESGWFYLALYRSGDAYPSQRLPMEITLHLEPPADTAGLPGPAEKQKQLAPPQQGRPHRIQGGTSYNDAAALAPGTYSDTFVPGETRYYRVHLAWGQRLAYQISIPSFVTPGPDEQPTAVTAIANPVRQIVAAEAEMQVLGPGEVAGSTLAPVRYTNRFAKDDDVKLCAIDGDYYLLFLATYQDPKHQAAETPLTVTVSVVGQAQTGPHYLTGAPNPSSGAPTTPTHASAARHGSSGPGVVVWAGVGALLAAAVGLTVWLFGPRRRRAG